MSDWRGFRVYVSYVHEYTYVRISLFVAYVHTYGSIGGPCVEVQ